jgi:hypothetical protein
VAVASQERNPMHAKEATIRVAAWRDAECLYRVNVRRSEAWTVVLIRDVDTPNWGWEVVPRAEKIAAQVCDMWNVCPERLVLVLEEDQCWPRSCSASRSPDSACSLGEIENRSHSPILLCGAFRVSTG